MPTPVDPHLVDRARKAARIIADPSGFKVCEACESIVAARVDICPNCFGYRFDPAPERVVEQATALGARAQQSVIADDLNG